MSFEDSPADLDPHGQCQHEIRALQAELSAVRNQARTDNLRAELADQYERWLLDLGRISGCGHLDERLPRCIEEEFEKIRDERTRYLGRVQAALEVLLPQTHSVNPSLAALRQAVAILRGRG